MNVSLLTGRCINLTLTKRSNSENFDFVERKQINLNFAQFFKLSTVNTLTVI